ncbi:4-(cytidine 5'-diphospho)-2-C-methyl-D-erythritol kinase [Sphingomonas oleivorans]|uniref:4-diphosphocytidyl-2-C-methyl-D-erythritol kinase n=1 Tax=Sphingomonas oleivorans TaxID=1735121 RepID=A0A2T5FWR7_9SPHN|nr:4-(cytidine 5'-diphospho)-2-C-methyl-D-erythritol kinase [Sphingomonas oleivorans]PTQ10223.1 4-(cytidine 5'-diphospho)-2-C-methyl-D-erythritol kinase [Sphingomonas oleivorans]
MLLAETGHAKINLALHVRSRGADGYHALETLFAFAEDGDRLTLAEGEGLSLDLSGPFAGPLAGDDNLVLRAARAFLDRFGLPAGAAFGLDKRLPVASGIGGGSADAAAALRLLCRRHDIHPTAPELMAIAASLGADVPACLVSRTMRGEGRGDALVPIDGEGLSGMALLLVNPGPPLATGPVFRAWDGRDRGVLARGDALETALAGRNDLEPPARMLLPAIGAVLERLAGQAGTRLVRMSGSGATCFALFEDEAARDAADRDIARAEPGWWRLATRLR